MSRIPAVFKLSGLALFLGVCVLLLMLGMPKGQWKALSVQTGSMRPAITPGDMVLVHSVPVSSLKVGDVITYISPKNPKQTVTHRIIQKLGLTNGPKTFIVKGDSNTSADAPVPQHKVIGRVQHKVPYAGYAVNFLHKPLGLAIIIWLPALVVIAREVQRLNRYYRVADPYMSAKISQRKKSSGPNPKYALVAKTTMFLVIASGITLVPIAYAAMTSTVTLTGNTISSATITPPPPPPTCSNTTVTSTGSGGNNSSTVVVNNSSSQTSTTGDASSTNGGTATSGNASNSNTTCINVTVHQ